MQEKRYAGRKRAPLIVIMLGEIQNAYSIYARISGRYFADRHAYRQAGRQVEVGR